jgi:hypothetical protein
MNTLAPNKCKDELADYENSDVENPSLKQITEHCVACHTQFKEFLRLLQRLETNEASDVMDAILTKRSPFLTTRTLHGGFQGAEAPLDRQHGLEAAGRPVSPGTSLQKLLQVCSLTHQGMVVNYAHGLACLEKLNAMPGKFYVISIDEIELAVIYAQTTDDKDRFLKLLSYTLDNHETTQHVQKIAMECKPLLCIDFFYCKKFMDPLGPNLAETIFMLWLDS